MGPFVYLPANWPALAYKWGFWVGPTATTPLLGSLCSEYSVPLYLDLLL